jgi:glycosyltransferase involved in cell wall biosynthesis
MKNPTISVILPVFNGERYLHSAINSILAQSFEDFELIIINDGSSDSSNLVIESFNDSRVKKISHIKNKGLINTLNHGIKLAKGQYIARMDQDDISDPLRFEKQLNFLRSSNYIALVGSLYAAIDEQSKFISIAAQPIRSADIRFALTTQNCFGHGSILIDKTRISKQLLLYPKDYEHAEDFALWVHLSSHKVEMYNLPEVLYSWRYHPSSISNRASVRQQESVNKILDKQHSQRIKFGVNDIWSFFISAYFNSPNKISFRTEYVESNLKKTYQYILLQYAMLIFRVRPAHALIAVVLAIFMAPLNIVRKYIHL